MVDKNYIVDTFHSLKENYPTAETFMVETDLEPTVDNIEDVIMNAVDVEHAEQFLSKTDCGWSYLTATATCLQQYWRII